MITISLPWPPSVNHIYESNGWGGSKRLSVAARQYRGLVAVRVIDARKRGDLPPAPLGGRLRVTVTAHPPTRARRDLDNLGKATLDALTHARVWIDDEQIDRLTFERGEVRKGGALSLLVEEASS